jgi:hypothetical protein
VTAPARTVNTVRYHKEEQVTAAISTPERPTPKAPALAAAGLALAIVVIVAGNYHVPKGENGGTGPAISTAVLCAVVTAAMFGLLVPRARRFERTTLMLGIVTVISLLAFWSGITPVLAATTFAVAARGTDFGKKSATGQALAVAAALLAVGWTLANSHLF